MPISRLQRDLTDSTVIRNIGVPLGHAVIAMQSTLKGLRKLLLHEDKIKADLANTWAVVAEAIQTILRRENYPHPYETLKALTRTNEAITEERIEKFIDELDVAPAVKAELRAISPLIIPESEAPWAACRGVCSRPDGRGTALQIYKVAP